MNAFPCEISIRLASGAVLTFSATEDEAATVIESLKDWMAREAPPPRERV